MINTNEGKPIENKGKLNLDATVADQDIAYPNDLGLLNKALEKTETIIDTLFVSARDKMDVKTRYYL